MKMQCAILKRRISSLCQQDTATIFATIDAAEKLMLEKKRLQELAHTDIVRERFNIFTRKDERFNTGCRNANLANCMSLFHELKQCLKTYFDIVLK